MKICQPGIFFEGRFLTFLTLSLQERIRYLFICVLGKGFILKSCSFFFSLLTNRPLLQWGRISYFHCCIFWHSEPREHENLCSRPPFSEVSVSHGQPLPKNIQWEVPETNDVHILNCTPFCGAWWTLSLPCTGHEASCCSGVTVLGFRSPSLYFTVAPKPFTLLWLQCIVVIVLFYFYFCWSLTAFNL